MKIGITGGTGLVGKRITALLLKTGNEVVILTRNVAGKKSVGGCSYALFDAANNTCDVAALQQLDAVIHLAGESVAGKRWSNQQKELIVSSRVQGTAYLIEQLRKHGSRCKTLVAASAIGYYGPDKQPIVPFTENQPPATDFLGETSRRWEEEEQKAADIMRTISLRIGIVLSKDGGAFYEFVKTAKFGLLPVPGTGRQVISWIHVEDLARLFVHALTNASMHGVYNAVAPAPVPTAVMMKEIAAAHKGFLITMPVPAFVLQIVLGEMSIEILKSCTVSAAHTLQSGFIYTYPDIGSAVKNLVK
jgi:uncharacterized protein (TIGR01777 family)